MGISSSPIANELDIIEECKRTKSTELNLSGLGLTNIPVQIKELTWITSLFLSNNEISSIENLDKLTNLKYLRLHNNKIRRIENLDKLTKLTQLWLHNNKINYIENLDKLTRLGQLRLDYNQISRIEKLNKFFILAELNLSGNQISCIENLENLTNLKQLWIDNNQINRIENLEKLVNLTRLGLHRNQISRIENLENLTILISLVLSNNQISRIENIDHLVNLTQLTLSDNQISRIENIEHLVNLTQLTLSGNQISRIEGLSTLVNLTELNFYDNRLTKIEGLAKLINLEKLWFHSNQLVKIEGLDTLVNLTSLWLNSNPIKDISPLLPLIKKGISAHYRVAIGRKESGIFLEDCPLKVPDIETVQRGNNAILAYFEEKNQREKQRKKIASYKDTPSVKMILFGNSGAGKTNLSKYLRTDKFDENDRDSTHGILIEHWTPDGENILAHIWDFGGQEYYHGAYRLFMTHKTVFMLLWEQGTNQNFGDKETLIKNKSFFVPRHEKIAHFELQYWLDNIAHFAPDSPIFVVQNKIDAPNNSKHRHFPELFEHYNIEDDFAISLKLGSDEANLKEYRNLQHFKKELLETLKLNAYDDSDWAQTRLKLRDLLIDLQEVNTDNKNPFLSYKDKLSISVSDFEAIMKTIVIDMQLSNTHEVLDWLHTRGIILFYKDNPVLNEKAFLQPKKVIDAIYDILNKKILDQDGQFSLKDIVKQETVNAPIQQYRRISKSQIKENQVNSKADDIVALMLQMEIIFKVPNAKNEYIAPQYLPETHALQDLYEIASEEIQNSTFSVKLPLFYYRRVMQQLILYYGKNQDTEDKNYKAYFWKHGILIKKDGIRLLIKGLYPNENESEGIISVATDKKKDYLKLQKEVFNEICSIAYGSIRLETKFDENYDGPDDDEIARMVKEDMKNNPEKYISDISEEQKELFNNKLEKINQKQEKMNQRIEVSSDGIHFTPYLNLLEHAEKNERKIQAFDKNKNTKYLIINDFEAMLDKVPERPLKVFISYAHVDGDYLDGLQAHLRTLRRSEIIDTWTDRKVVAGEYWDEKIMKEIQEADVIIMLMSAYFIDSDYIWEKEVKAAFESHSKGRLVLPIYTKPFDFHGLTWKPAKEEIEEGESTEQVFHLSKIQWLPFNTKGKLQAISTWSDRDEAFSEVAKKIRAAIEGYKTQSKP